LYVMPGDPVHLLVSSFQIESSQEKIDEIKNRFGLNDPIPVQFLRYVAGVVQGNLGDSILKSRPVSRLIVEALPHTLELAALALMIAILVGITAGVLSAAWRGTWLDRSSIFVSLLGVSMPDFWMAILVVLVFAVKLQWFPAFGVGGISFLVLPAVVL